MNQLSSVDPNAIYFIWFIACITIAAYVCVAIDGYFRRKKDKEKWDV